MESRDTPFSRTMHAFISGIRNGSAVTRERVVHYSLLLLLIYTLGITVGILQADGLISRDGQPLGADFSNVYAAGELALQGRAADAYHPPVHHAMMQQVFADPHTPYYAWSYPPFFLFIAAALALLPYFWALIVWQAASLGFYAFAMRALLRDAPGGVWDRLLPCLAYPAVFINVIHGQNGLFSAALLGLGLCWLEKRPLAAGVMLGLLSYKPHFGILIPPLLIVTARWKTFLTASAVVITLSLLSPAVFGQDVWPAFFDSLSFTRHVILEQGDTGWWKMQSAFAAVRDWGFSLSFAYTAQCLVALLTAALTLRAWHIHRRADAPQIAMTAAACLLLTPYALDYDMLLLATGIAALASAGLRQGFLPYEKCLLAAVWVTPFIARSFMQITHIPLGLLSTALLFYLAWRRGRKYPAKGIVAAPGAML